MIDKAASAETLKAFPLEIRECRYLITTDDRGIGLLAEAEPVAVGEMTSGEAKALLQHHLGSEAPPEKVLEPLAAELGRFPLALRVAAHVLRSAEEGSRVGASWPPPATTAMYAPRDFVERLVDRLRSSPGNDLTAGVQEALAVLSKADQDRLALLAFASGANPCRSPSSRNAGRRTRARPAHPVAPERPRARAFRQLRDRAPAGPRGGRPPRPDLDVDRTHDAAFAELSPENQAVARQPLPRGAALRRHEQCTPQSVSAAQLTPEQNLLLDRLAQLKLLAYGPEAKARLRSPTPRPPSAGNAWAAGWTRTASSCAGASASTPTAPTGAARKIPGPCSRARC